MTLHTRPANPKDGPAMLAIRAATRENRFSLEALAAAGITTESLARDLSAGTLAGWVSETEPDGEVPASAWLIYQPANCGFWRCCLPMRAGASAANYSPARRSCYGGPGIPPRGCGLPLTVVCAPTVYIAPRAGGRRLDEATDGSTCARRGNLHPTHFAKNVDCPLSIILVS